MCFIFIMFVTNKVHFIILYFSAEYYKDRDIPLSITTPFEMNFSFVMKKKYHVRTSGNFGELYFFLVNGERRNPES